MSHSLNPMQSAAAAQFNQQCDRYGKSHILADTRDVEGVLRNVAVPKGGKALDIGYWTQL